MKTLNFSVLEILPSLLDKSKTQTIRPAWKEIEIKEGVKLDKDRKIICRGIKGKRNFEMIEKPHRFKAGDKVKLY